MLLRKDTLLPLSAYQSEKCTFQKGLKNGIAIFMFGVNTVCSTCTWSFSERARHAFDMPYQCGRCAYQTPIFCIYDNYFCHFFCDFVLIYTYTVFFLASITSNYKQFWKKNLMSYCIPPSIEWMNTSIYSPEEERSYLETFLNFTETEGVLSSIKVIPKSNGNVGGSIK